jgi:1-acyl-sn-glycerol-3-phosphate acyltransferase
MKILRTLHTAYGFVVFSVLFLIFFPLLLIPVIFPRWFRLVGIFNRWWARLLFFFVFIPFRVEYRARLDHKRQYIFCSNHFSYLDIPAMGLNHHDTIFVGKSIPNIPLFSFMYRKLHITLNRESLKSRVNSLKLSLQAIEEGKSLVIFPEGGIVTEKDPVLSRFKDGAFRVAIEKQIPIVPVVIPYNWIILPPDQFLLRWHPLKLVMLEPVPTEGLTLRDVDMLKEKIFELIDAELQRHLVEYENRSRVIG